MNATRQFHPTITRFAFASMDNARRPYVMLFERSIDTSGRQRTRCKVQQASSPRHAAEIVRDFENPGVIH